MKNKVVKLNERTLENLVKKVIREEKLNNINEDRDDHEMSGSKNREDYVPSPRERGIEKVFGKYSDDVPPSVVRYMRKNPDTILRRMSKLYPDIYMKYTPEEMDIDYLQEDMKTQEKIQNIITMERNYKPIQIFNKYYVSLETYSHYHDKWTKHLFKDLLGEDLTFMNKKDAEDWIDARRDVMNV